MNQAQRRKKRTNLSSLSRCADSSSNNPGNTCLSGFHYDINKKRYFRLLPGNNNSNPLTTESLKAAEIEKLRKTKSSRATNLRPQSLSKALLNPLRGFSSPAGFCAFVQQERMSNFTKCVSRQVVQNLIELLADKCRYLQGRTENGMVVGAWYSEKEGLVIHSLSLWEESNSSESILSVKRGRVVNIHPSSLQLADLRIVEVSPDLLFALYAGNYINQERESIGTIHLLPIREHCDSSTPENRELTDSRTQNYEFSGKHIWSCCFNESTKSIFAGSKGTVERFGVEDASHSVFKVPNENVFSLCTNANGQTLYSGTNKGQLIWYDTRSDAAVGKIKIGRGTSYLKVLEDEHKIVVSSFDDSLVQVDLRERKPLFSYPEHKNEHRKLPFSIDEPSNVLCSIGQDKITRLWSLRDGKILTSVLPPEIPVCDNAVPEPWVWYSDHWNIKAKSQKTQKSCLVVAAENEVLLYSPE